MEKRYCKLVARTDSPVFMAKDVFFNPANFTLKLLDSNSPLIIAEVSYMSQRPTALKTNYNLLPCTDRSRYTHVRSTSIETIVEDFRPLFPNDVVAMRVCQVILPPSQPNSGDSRLLVKK